jgi:hypothetical protein
LHTRDALTENDRPERRWQAVIRAAGALHSGRVLGGVKAPLRGPSGLSALTPTARRAASADVVGCPFLCCMLRPQTRAYAPDTSINGTPGTVA